MRPEVDKILRELRASRERRHGAEAVRAGEMRAIAELLREAEIYDIPIAHLAEAAGLTRQTVYDVLRRQEQS